MCATNQICQKSNRSVVLEPQSIHSLSANPGHHVGAYKLVVCDQENGAPSSLSSSQGPWYLPRWNRPWAFLIYPSVIMPKLNSEQIHGSASSLHPSGSTSWIVDKKKSANCLCPSYHLENKFYVDICNLRIQETLPQPRMLLWRQGCRLNRSWPLSLTPSFELVAQRFCL